jgi:hypothetical protein
MVLRGMVMRRGVTRCGRMCRAAALGVQLLPVCVDWCVLCKPGG